MRKNLCIKHQIVFDVISSLSLKEIQINRMIVYFRLPMSFLCYVMLFVHKKKMHDNQMTVHWSSRWACKPFRPLLGLATTIKFEKKNYSNVWIFFYLKKKTAFNDCERFYYLCNRPILITIVMLSVWLLLFYCHFSISFAKRCDAMRCLSVCD